MLLDAVSLSSDDTIDADVCIIGAGPAGITLAREFADDDIKVLLLESGRFEFDSAIQALYQARAVSTNYLPDAPLGGRRRQFGGTANLWVHHVRPGDGRVRARMMLPEEIDFEQRKEVPHSGWPFPRSVLAPYFKRAQAVCQLGPFDYSWEAWGSPDAVPISFPDKRLTTVIGQFVASDVFTHRYRDDLIASENITLCINGNMIYIEADGDPSTVRRVRVATLAGSQFWVRADCFVLAAGGLENPRLLLLSDGAHPNGLGNEHDMVGRFLTEHQAFRLGVIHPSSKSLFQSLALYDLRQVGPFMVGGSLALHEEVLRQEGLLNMCAVLAAHPRGAGSSADKSLKMLYGLRRGERSRDFARHLARVVLRPADTAGALRTRTVWRDTAFSENRGGWSLVGEDQKKLLGVFDVVACCEQAPNPNNRVMLTSERDWLGRRKAEVHLTWSEEDRRRVRRGREIVAEELTAAGIGRFEPWVAFEGPERPLWPGIHHPMGATRMHTDPAQGVVNEDCRVHGVANLYVAGSSVFPTGLGYANPTFTILALALRLADHIKAATVSSPSGGD
jgi:choline dehydrogenase-like flavoprotein